MIAPQNKLWVEYTVCYTDDSKCTAVFASHFRRVIGCPKVNACCEERPHSWATATQTRHDRYHPKEMVFLKLLTNEGLPKAWETNAVDHGKNSEAFGCKECSSANPQACARHISILSEVTTTIPCPKFSNTLFLRQPHHAISCAMCIGTHRVIWALCVHLTSVLRSFGTNNT